MMTQIIVCVFRSQMVLTSSTFPTFAVLDEPNRIECETMLSVKLLGVDKSMDGIIDLETKSRNGYVETHCGRMVRRQ